MEFTREQLEWVAKMFVSGRTMRVEQPVPGGSEIVLEFKASDLATEALRQRDLAVALNVELQSEREKRARCEAGIAELQRKLASWQPMPNRDRGYYLHPSVAASITDVISQRKEITDLERDLDVAWDEREVWRRRAERAVRCEAAGEVHAVLNGSEPVMVSGWVPVGPGFFAWCERVATEAASTEGGKPAASEHVEEVTVDCGDELGRQEVTELAAEFLTVSPQRPHESLVWAIYHAAAWAQPVSPIDNWRSPADVADSLLDVWRERWPEVGK